MKSRFKLFTNGIVIWFNTHAEIILVIGRKGSHIHKFIKLNISN